jgi:multidrug efflux pump subunit AcrA (membrane-fusion protein)
VSRHHEEEKPEHAEHAEEKKEHGEGVIKLDKKQQEAAHIQAALPQKAQMLGEVKGYGRVLDPAQIVALVLEAQAAQATANASQKEFERLKTLYSQGQNASARAMETAEANMKRDQTLIGLAEAKLRAAVGRDLVERKDFGEIIQGLSKMEWALARIDVLAGAPEKLPANVRVAPLANENAMISAELIGMAPAADAAVQGRGFLLLIKTNSLAPNTAIVGSIEVSGHDTESLLVPASALLQEGPETVVFVQASDDTFKKVPVEVARMTEKGAFITEGLAATNRVVVSGAHQILSVTKAEAEE